MNKKLLVIIMVLVVFVVSMFAGQETVNKTFKAKKNIIIKNVCGDCTIKKGDSSEIVVKLVYTFSDDCFRTIFEENDDELIIREKFTSNKKCKGKSSWVIYVPQKTNVKFYAASGDFTLFGIEGDVKVNTASGDIEVSKSKGNFEVCTASGDIDIHKLSGDINFTTASGDVTGKDLDGTIKLVTASGDVDCVKLNGTKVYLNSASGSVETSDSKGRFKLHSASGDVTAKDIEITGASKFGTASGDVLVTLTKTAKFNMVLSSASGDAKLDYQGNKIMGKFEFLARKTSGDIKAPFSFDKEEVIKKYRKEYWLKSFTRGKVKPEIYIKTSTGTAKLVK